MPGHNQGQEPRASLTILPNFVSTIVSIIVSFNGLCYKFTISDALSSVPLKSPNVFVSSYNDDLKNINLLIAEDNTWQGVIGGEWPYR